MSLDKEAKYIKERKRQARHLRLKFLKMQVFPIQQKKIVFTAFEGDGGYCCNPRYIAEEFLRRGWDGEMIWLTKKIEGDFPIGIRPVMYTPWNIAYHLSTAEIWIDNYRKPLGTIKRKGQLYIQTWHASMGFKAVGNYRGKLFPKIAKIVSKADSALIDYVLSNSDYCTAIYPMKLLYNGAVLKTGSPRCDSLICRQNEIYKELRAKYRIPFASKLVLYAPTFRGGNQSCHKEVKKRPFSIEFNRVINALKEKTQCDWAMLIRVHPQLAARKDSLNIDGVYDVSLEDDMSCILGAVDLVLTDYSSCAFDALFAGIPVILYADDIEEYKKNRGMFMWKRGQHPFDVAENNSELMKIIDKFNIYIYKEKRKIFMDEYNVLEDGKASARVVNIIEQWRTSVVDLDNRMIY